MKDIAYITYINLTAEEDNSEEEGEEAPRAPKTNQHLDLNDKYTDTQLSQEKKNEVYSSYVYLRLFL